MFCAVPELTRGAAIQLNERLSLRRHAAMLDVPGMKQKQRKPKDLAEKLDKSLRVRYAEVVKLRELVKKAASKVRGDGKSSDRRR